MSFEQEKQDFINELKAGNIDHFDVIDDLILGTNFTGAVQYRNDFEVMSMVLEIIFYEQRSNFANLIEDVFFRSIYKDSFTENINYFLLNDSNVQVYANIYGTLTCQRRALVQR